MRSWSMVLSLTIAGVAPLPAQTVRDFFGTYELVRVESLDASGQWVLNTTSFGPEPLGVVMYDGEGTMGVHIVRRERDAERTASGYFAYYGRYEVDAERGIVTHHLESHINPRQAASDMVRGFDFDGDLLTLTVERQRRLRLVWRRRSS